MHVGQYLFKPEVPETGTLHPEKLFRVSWDGIMLVLLLYIAVMVPIELGSFKLNQTKAHIVLDVLVDLLFIIDIGLNFRTGYYDKAKACTHSLHTHRTPTRSYPASRWAPLGRSL